MLRREIGRNEERALLDSAQSTSATLCMQAAVVAVGLSSG